MAHPLHHAMSSVKKWGGTPEDYLPIHSWFDQSKELHGDFRHRMLRHHTQGIFEAERVFGTDIVISTGRRIPVRWIGEQHVIEDCGRLLTFSDWASQLSPKSWMNKFNKLEKLDPVLEAQSSGAAGSVEQPDESNTTDIADR